MRNDGCVLEASRKLAITREFRETVPIEDLAWALLKHWGLRHGDGTPVVMQFGLPYLSRHTSSNGCSFVIRTSGSAGLITALLAHETLTQPARSCKLLAFPQRGL